MIAQQLLNALGIGCTYALIALGYNLIFGVLKIVNLAYGDIFMVGAFSGYACSLFTTNLFAVSVAAMFGSACASAIVYFIGIRPIGHVSDIDSHRHLMVLASTIGWSFVLENLAILTCGAYPHSFPHFYFELRSSSVIVNTALRVGIEMTAALVMMCGLLLLLKKTRLGLRLRAISENPELSSCAGIDVWKDQTFAVLISGVLAGAAAVLVCGSTGMVSPFIGTSYGMKGLVVIIIAGLGNVNGVLWISLLLGLVEVASVNLFSSSYRDGFAFAALVLLLACKARPAFKVDER